MLLLSYIKKYSNQEQVKYLKAHQRDRYISMQLKRLIQEMSSDYHQNDKLRVLLTEKEATSGLPPAFLLVRNGLAQCAIAFIDYNATSIHEHKSLLRYALEIKNYRAASEITDNYLDLGNEQSYLAALNAYPQNEISSFKLILSHADIHHIRDAHYRKMLIQVLERFPTTDISTPDFLKLHQVLSKVESLFSSKPHKYADPIIEEMKIMKKVGSIIEQLEQKVQLKPKENKGQQGAKMALKEQMINAKSKPAKKTISLKSIKSLREEQSAIMSELTMILNDITEVESKHFESLSAPQKCLALESNRIHQLLGKRFEEKSQTCCEFEKQTMQKIKTLKSFR